MKYSIRYIDNYKINSLLSLEQDLYRPDFPFRSILLHLACFFFKILFLSFIFYYSFFLYYAEYPDSFSIIFLVFFVFCFVADQKKLAVFCIRLYQRFAPASIRLKCCCEPSCSQYTIIALQKYGLLIGLLKGFIHYKRCKPPGLNEFP